MTLYSPSWKAQRQRGRWLRTFLLAFALIVFLAPLGWTFLASFGVIPNNSQSPPTWSSPPTADNYIEIGVTTPTFLQALETSTTVSVATTLVTIAISFLAAYALVSTRFRGRWLVVQGLLILASVPVMAYALPLLTIVRSAHLYDTFAGITLADSAVFAPLAVYVLCGYVQQVSPELIEAAKLEGANLGQTLWDIVLPGILPGLSATAIIIFVLNWNLLLVPMLLSESRVKTIPVILTDFFQLERELEWKSAAAVLITSLVPLAVLITSLVPLVVLIVAAHRILERLNLLAAQPKE